MRAGPNCREEEARRGRNGLAGHTVFHIKGRSNVSPAVSIVWDRRLQDAADLVARLLVHAADQVDRLSGHVEVQVARLSDNSADQVARFSDKAEVQVARLSGRAEVQVDRLSGHAVALDALPWDPAPGQPSWRRDHVAGHPFWRWDRAAGQVARPEDRVADLVFLPEDRVADQAGWLPDHVVDRVVEAGQRDLCLRRASGQVEPRRRRPTHPLVAIRPLPATELARPARLPMGCTATFGNAGNRTRSSPSPPENKGRAPVAVYPTQAWPKW